MLPESPRPGIKDQLTGFLMHWLRQFFYYVCWRWPVDAATWVGTVAFDRPTPTLVAASPALVFVAGVWLIAAGAWRGLWYPALVTMWANEDVARRNVAITREGLDRWDRLRPARVRARMMTREEQAELEAWRARRQEIASALEEERRGVPSWWSPYPAEQPGQVTPDAAFLYHADHLLFGSVYPYVPLAFLLLGAWRGWRRSRTRRAGQWETAWDGQSADRVLLGVDDAGQGHFLEERVRPHHLLVVGTTGSGKSVALEHLARADIHAGRGLLFADLKGERSLTQAIHRHCVATGRAKDFRLFTFDGPSHSYNPLGRGDATALRDRILSACVWSDEVFYKNAASSVLGRYLPPMLRRGRITVVDVYNLLTDRFAPPLVGRWMNDEDARRAEEDTADWLRFQKYTAALLDNVSEFALPEFRDRLAVPYADIDLAEALSKNLVVVFELNSQMRPKAAATLGRMVLEDLKHVGGSLARDRQAQKPFHVYLDEAGRAVYPGFAGLIAQCRSAGIGLTLAAQSPSDFDTEEGKLMTTVLQNTGTKLILRQLDPDSAELGARLGGTYETFERTRHLVDQGILLGTNESGRLSEREIDKYIVHPNVLKRMPNGRAYLIGADTRVLVDLCPPERKSREPAELPAPPPTRRGDGPVLDLPRLVAEERKKIAEENRRAAEKQDAAKDEKAPKESADEGATDPNIVPVDADASEPSAHDDTRASAKPQQQRIERPAKRGPRSKARG